MRASGGFCVLLATLLLIPATGRCQGEVLEFVCRSCGYRERLVQGANAADRARNVQHVIVVCERTGEIRDISIPIDPHRPVRGEPLLGRRLGTGRSELLGEWLPKYIVPGNTCPLFPITAYLERNICPIDGRPGIQYSVVGYY
jgi:RNase P subunit RPR2